MGMIGITREVAAVYDKELKIPEVGLEADDLDCPVTIEIKDPVGCPRYLARYLEEVKIVPSPAWMAARLLSAGFRPISNVVDATNYVLLETGQPLHAFDADKVKDERIIVRRAKAREKLKTLDGIERTLDERDLVIADPGRAIALAGVMGGEDSEVGETTTSIILEAASFDKASISFTSRRHNLRSEASARFERGSNPDALPYAAARAARFMKETGGGKVSRREPDAYPAVREREHVRLRPSRTSRLLGLEVPVERQVAEPHPPEDPGRGRGRRDRGRGAELPAGHQDRRGPHRGGGEARGVREDHRHDPSRSRGRPLRGTAAPTER